MIVSGSIVGDTALILRIAGARGLVAAYWGMDYCAGRSSMSIPESVAKRKWCGRAQGNVRPRMVLAFVLVMAIFLWIVDAVWCGGETFDGPGRVRKSVFGSLLLVLREEAAARSRHTGRH